MSEEKALQLIDAFTALGTENQALRDEISTAHELIEEHRMALSQLQSEVHEAGVLKQRYASLAQEFQNRFQHMKALEHSHGLVTDRIGELGIALEKMQCENLELARRQQEQESHQRQVENTQRELVKAYQLIDELKRDCENLRNQLDEASSQRSELLNTMSVRLLRAASEREEMAFELHVEQSRRSTLETFVLELRSTIEAMDRSSLSRQQEWTRTLSNLEQEKCSLRSEHRRQQVQVREEKDLWVRRETHLKEQVRSLLEHSQRLSTEQSNMEEKLNDLQKTHRETLASMRAQHQAEVSDFQLRLQDASKEGAKVESRMVQLQCSFEKERSVLSAQLGEYLDLRQQWADERAILQKELTRQKELIVTLEWQQGTLEEQVHCLTHAYMDLEGDLEQAETELSKLYDKLDLSDPLCIRSGDHEAADRKELRVMLNKKKSGGTHTSGVGKAPSHTKSKTQRESRRKLDTRVNISNILLQTQEQLGKLYAEVDALKA